MSGLFSMNGVNQDFPALLLPVKIETRFVNISGERPELWVRAFPDLPFIHSFNPLITVEEHRDRQRFLDVSANSGGIEDISDQKESWKYLVQKYGVHRASWIVQISEDDLEAQNQSLAASNKERPVENDQRFAYRWLPKFFKGYLYRGNEVEPFKEFQMNDITASEFSPARGSKRMAIRF